MSKASLLKAALLAPIRPIVRTVAPHGVKEAALLVASRVLGVAHRTNASGNNMSQR